MAAEPLTSRLPTWTVAWDATRRGTLVRWREAGAVDGRGVTIQDTDEAMVVFWSKVREVQTKFALAGMVER